jgi:hypothetical protein
MFALPAAFAADAERNELLRRVTQDGGQVRD